MLTALGGCTSHQTLFRKALKDCKNRVINLDKNAVYPKAIDELKAKIELSLKVELRQKKCLNNISEQNHQDKAISQSKNGIWVQHSARRTWKKAEISKILYKGAFKERVKLMV